MAFFGQVRAESGVHQKTLKINIRTFAAAFFISSACLLAASPDFSIGWEKINGRRLWPDYRADWQYNAASGSWEKNGQWNPRGESSESDFSFVYLGYGKTKEYGAHFSAGFETGLYLPFSSSASRWDLPYSSTSTAVSTSYNWCVAPSTYSALYNKEDRKLFVIPVMVRGGYDAGRFLKLSLAGGVYIARMETERTYGEEYKKDYTGPSGGALVNFRKGDVQEYRYWSQDTHVIPAVRADISSWVMLTETANLDFSFYYGRMKKTDFLTGEETLNGVTMKNGIEIGGAFYGFSAGVKVLF